MEHEDINRITKELEGLLMMNEKTASVRDKEQNREGQQDWKGQESFSEASGNLEEDSELLEEIPEEFQENSEILDEAADDLPEDPEAFQEEMGWEDWEEDRDPGSRKWTLVRPWDGLVVAFLAPMIIMLIIFAQRGIFPFGEESFLRTDMYHQYAPFFSEFRNKLAQGESLLYSWNVGMGVNFSALYAYYLASPLNWLLVLCPEKLVIEFMTYMIVLKTGL